MLELSKPSQYAVVALTYFAGKPKGDVIITSEIAVYFHLPEKSLAAVLRQLSKTGLLRTVRGASGGFVLDRDATQMTLREVVEAMEGTVDSHECLRGLAGDQCPYHGDCRFQAHWRGIQERVMSQLSQINISDLRASIGDSRGVMHSVLPVLD